MGNTPETKGIAPDAVQAALDRITASRTFAKAPRAVRLLRYLSDAVLDGRQDGLKEYTIALELYGRTNYDPKVDSTVRVEASKLRALLARYYDSEGASDSVRIVIPKGSYVADFSAPPVVNAPPLQTRHLLPAQWSGPAVLWSALALLVAISAGVATTWPWLKQLRASPRGPIAAIAVLPFLDLSSARNHEYLADGIAEELTNSLSQWNGIRVAPRRSAFQYKGRSVDVRRVGADLNVQAVLEGSVRVDDGNAVRVTVQLVDTKTDLHLWGRVYSREMLDVLKIQAEIAGEVTRYLQLDMADTRRALTRPAPTNVEAWQYYLRAVRMSEAGPDLETVRDSLAFFDIAVELDPGYAVAWAAMSRKICTFVEWGLLPPHQVMPRAEHAARKAISLEGSLSDAHDALARVSVLRNRDWKTAEREFRLAADLDSGNIDSRLAYARYVLSLQGRFDEAATTLRQALAHDPMRWDVQHELAASLARGGNIAAARRALEKNPVSDSPLTNIWHGVFAMLERDHTGAIRYFRNAADANPGRWTLGYLGHALAVSGDARGARAVLDRLRGIAVSQVDEAVVYAALGDKDRALTLLENSEAVHLPAVLWANVDYRLSTLHNEPRFQALIAKLGLR